ncbi:DUF4136 domain-containing protein [Salegentibacter sp. F188]|uniref:DUF4136 domain-containing protein n=1 Tax=Autumnicola patrickiae TaxID=3075591 RepID=A0ABU3DXT9_9FLAO|nr:DUF4136 domain-containing protein [Salegentibacter sp. F188]MDT0688518.1 DUF4136 domain-containing protein [Salegentibacter sp. F188]
MKHFKPYLLILLATLTLAACGSGAGPTKDNAKKLKSYDSYAYLPNKDTIKSRKLDNAAIQENIIESINMNLQEEGYVLDKGQPDVLIYVHAMFDENIAGTADPVFTSYSYYKPGHYIGAYYEPYTYENYYTVQRISGSAAAQLPYAERTIVIDFIDRRTNEILWRAHSSEEIGTRRMESDIQENIDEVFKDFP